ncbi:MAG TPA: 1,2-phenylacetyl-CoA epoxidase subunit PaaC [Thermomicrobiales bacterium]|nr:1,2-phenylacetyl-CoA epoxidase subunit PaaC [Thermomicrobiales bacterium]
MSETAATAEQPAFTGPDDLDGATRDALAELLLALADDEFVLGFWDSEWTGIAPALEEDVAYSSIAQDEIGHARALYDLLADLTGRPADEIAYARGLEGFRQARLLDLDRGDWAHSIARRYLYDTADVVRLAALAQSTYRPLANLLAKVRREEVYHLQHFDAWLRRLSGDAAGRARLTAALDALWPAALDLFTPLAGEDVLLRAGILPRPFAALRAEWLAALAPIFADIGRSVPARPDAAGVYQPTIAPVVGGRDGDHDPAFRRLWDEMTMVYREEPGATW